MDHFPNFRGENKTSLKPPPSYFSNGRLDFQGVSFAVVGQEGQSRSVVTSIIVLYEQVKQLEVKEKRDPGCLGLYALPRYVGIVIKPV